MCLIRVGYWVGLTLLSKPKIGNTEIFEKVKSSNILTDITADSKRSSSYNVSRKVTVWNYELTGQKVR